MFSRNGFIKEMALCFKPTAALKVPAYANDGGEEPEVAGAYVVDEAGNALANWLLHRK